MLYSVYTVIRLLQRLKKRRLEAAADVNLKKKIKEKMEEEKMGVEATYQVEEEKKLLIKSKKRRIE